MIIDVVIPSKTNYSNLHMVRECIASLRRSEFEHSFNVILVESSAIAEDVGQDITVHYDGEFRYNRALNMGIAKGSAEWVILANNDLVFHPWFFTWIHFYSQKFPAFESFSPWNDIHGWHARRFPAIAPIIPGHRITYELAGWCIVTKRTVLDRIQLSDRVKLWFSDNIYADELQRLGIGHALIPQSKVDHLTSQTIDFGQYDTNEDYRRYLGEYRDDN
jgi:glycosyltransferase involved in cell wall biosynthesis